MMDVVSPTSVAAPCRLEETAMQMSSATGEVFSFLAMDSATGAIIRTVATLSTNADTTPAKTDSATATHMTLGVFCSSRSAMRSGIFDSMNSATVPIVPASIRRTFQSMAEKTDPSGIAPETTKMTAEISATYGRFLGRAIIRIYVIAKRMMVNSFMTGLLTFLFHFFREYFTAARGSGQPDKIAGAAALSPQRR